MLTRQINLQNKTNSLLNWMLQPKSLCLNGEKGFVIQSIFDSINASYCALDESKVQTNKKEYDIKRIDDKKYNTKFLQPVLKIAEIIRDEVSDYILDFILHGSLSTHDFIPGWSDFDSMVIIKNETLGDSFRMMRLRSIFFDIDSVIKEIDNHQHHGIHFITEKDLLMYPSLFLPPDIFKDSVSLSEGGSLTLFNRDSRDEEIKRFNSIYSTFKKAYSGGVLMHHEYNGEYLMRGFMNYQNAMYQLKYFLSVVTILPSYFMNILGKYPRKGQSIEDCRSIMKGSNFEIIDKATLVRSKWNQFPVVSNEIPIDVMNILGENYFSDGYNLIKEMKKFLEV